MNYTTSYALASITSWLGCKIIAISMNDNSLANNRIGARERQSFHANFLARMSHVVGRQITHIPRVVFVVTRRTVFGAIGVEMPACRVYRPGWNNRPCREYESRAYPVPNR